MLEFSGWREKNAGRRRAGCRGGEVRTGFHPGRGGQAGSLRRAEGDTRRSAEFVQEPFDRARAHFKTRRARPSRSAEIECRIPWTRFPCWYKLKSLKFLTNETRNSSISMSYLASKQNKVLSRYL
jgi:hypothetical protein